MEPKNRRQLVDPLDRQNKGHFIDAELMQELATFWHRFLTTRVASKDDRYVYNEFIRSVKVLLSAR